MPRFTLSTGYTYIYRDIRPFSYSLHYSKCHIHIFHYSLIYFFVDGGGPGGGGGGFLLSHFSFLNILRSHNDGTVRDVYIYLLSFLIFLTLSQCEWWFVY